MAHGSAAHLKPRAFLTHVGNGSSVVFYAPGEPIYTQGDPADALFYIQQGKVKVSVVSELGKEAVIALLEPTEFFGEGGLAGQDHRSSTASSLSTCVISRLDNATVHCLFRDDPAFASKFVAHLLSRSTRVEADMIDKFFHTSEKRLARLLLLMANYGTDSPPEPIIANISQEMLAQMIGTTRARVSLFMNRFRRLGYISYNGKIEVHSTLLNAVLDDIPEDRD